MALRWVISAWCWLLAVVMVAALSPDESTMLIIEEDLKGGSKQWDTSDSSPCNWPGVNCTGNGSVWNLDLSNLDLIGVFSPSISRLTSLTNLDLSRNKLTGTIPASIASLTSLTNLDLSRNKLTGTIPRGIASLTSLHNFSAYSNQLQGLIPQLNIKTLNLINLASNSLNGTIPANLCAYQQLSVLILSDNNLTGPLPPDLGSCSSLTALRVGQNGLNGSIPNSYGSQLYRLTYFEADHNQLDGFIPFNLDGWHGLTLLNLANNFLSGHLPAALSNLTSLQELDLSGNGLSGSIPNGFLNGLNLVMLDLSKNQFVGVIPDDLCKMPKLQNLRLESNQFNGSLPSCIGNCSELLELQLGNNDLSGSIPITLGSLLNLQVSLTLSMNQFTGSIPSSLDNLNKLVSLDLSYNELSGDIPYLGNMASLTEANFSHNYLSGTVPQIGVCPRNVSVLVDLSNNPGLVSDPLSLCPGDETYNSRRKESHNSKGKLSILAIVGITVASVVIAVAVLLVIAVAMMQKHQFSSTVDPINSPVFSRIFKSTSEHDIDFKSIKEATFNGAQVISNNRLSTMYKVVLPSGFSIAVKRLHSPKNWLTTKQRKITLELEKLVRLEDDNIMKPMGYFLEDDLALIIYDFVPACSLKQKLHSFDNSLPWSSRYDIFVAVARGLTFLHLSNPPIKLLDVTSKNIYLGSQFEVKIGDIEGSKLLDPFKSTGSISAVAGTPGYIAPEYAFTMQITFESNIFSFGVVLLELLTGRNPTGESFGEGLDLVSWVHGASSRGEVPEQILDSRISAQSFATRQEMLAVLKVALLCTNASSSRRPQMKKVLEMLLGARCQ